MATKEDGESLRRLGGGRWQTRDERFTIEPQSGTWVILDAEQTDELGLPLVRGPYRSLTDAKDAIATARTAAPPESPLASQVEKAARRATTAQAKTKRPGKAREEKAEAEPPPPPEPSWLTELPAGRRREARTLIERLTALGADDPEDVVRGALVRDAPDLARFALVRRLRELADDGKATEEPLDLVGAVAEALAHGRDRDLDIGWRLVDDEGRPIPLRAEDLRVKRRAKGRQG